MNPRRSSRARTSHPATASAAASSSSGSSGRAETSTRSNNGGNNNNSSGNHRTLSHRSSAQRSQSADTENAHHHHPQTRHRSARDHDANAAPSTIADEPEEDDADEEEITRCVCGQQEYPGLPPRYRDSVHKLAANKDEQESTAASDALDEIGGLFIQCDSCKVWQHGGCVGIMEESSSPDEYFCEQCRKDLHQLATSSNG